MSHAASIITAVIQTAASAHCTPVDPLSLMDISQTAYAHYLRGRLNSLVAVRLHDKHDIHIDLIAKAYRLDRGTVYSRIKTGRKLIRTSPWKQTYLKLP